MHSSAVLHASTGVMEMVESDESGAVRRGRDRLPGQSLALVVIALSRLTLAQADDAPSDPVTYRPDYVSVLPGYAMPSRAYGTTGSGFTVSGIYGYQFEPRWSVEANVQGSVFETGLNK